MKFPSLSFPSDDLAQIPFVFSLGHISAFSFSFLSGAAIATSIPEPQEFAQRRCYEQAVITSRCPLSVYHNIFMMSLGIHFVHSTKEAVFGFPFQPILLFCSVFLLSCCFFGGSLISLLIKTGQQNT